MLEKIKSVLTRTPPAFPPASSPASTSDAIAAQQKKTAAQVERLRVELAAAERAYTEAETAEGECLVDGRDATNATDARRKADDRVRAVKAALSVAMTKNQAALADLANANLQASIAADDAVVAAAKASAMKMETLLFGELKLRADELAAALQAVIDRSASDSGVGSARTDLGLWFPRYLHRACVSLIRDGQLHAEVIDKEPFSSWVDKVAYAMTYRRKGR